MMSFRTMIDEKKARGFDGRIVFQIGEETFLVRVRKEKLRVARGSIGAVDATISGRPEQIAAVVYGGAPAEGLAFAGDEALARRFLSLFTLPPKVEAAGTAS
jgi:hypothetical protein